MARPKPAALPLGDGPMNFYISTFTDIFLYKNLKILFMISMDQVKSLLF